jgi:hypothetical protein
MLDERGLAKMLLGLGIVVTLPRRLNQRWTERAGKEWSAFNGAVRAYRAGLDFEHDAPAHHPLALADRILGFQRGKKVAEVAFAEFLVEQAQLFAATKRVDWKPCVFYAEAVQREAAVARARDKGNDEWRRLYGVGTVCRHPHRDQDGGCERSGNSGRPGPSPEPRRATESGGSLRRTKLSPADARRTSTARSPRPSHDRRCSRNTSVTRTSRLRWLRISPACDGIEQYSIFRRAWGDADSTDSA